MKILIIEDDAGLNRGISFALEQDGCQALCARTLKEGLTLFEKETPDAVILDLNLPDGDGMDFCKTIRRLPGEKAKTPLLMLTARDMEVDEIMGLSSGADDYMTKPFSISVLKIRLQNIIQRRVSDKETPHMLTSGKITIDTSAFRAFNEDTEIVLSITEFRLLQYFLENKNKALLKEQILQHVWDADGNFVEENTLSVNISRLRKKLGGNYIRTIQGIGYLWEENP
ncbi:MAG: response regulator transcription factor [Bacillus sp. (in: Bacteria)]|nr:response regulator transcription factor [Bacillus sp. (in: firmicutes)]MCM1426621.1 response regulator transcription factor [Eubacterium sp.]